MDIKNLPGSFKAAILIHSLGQEASTIIMSRMDKNERELITKYLNEIGDISHDVVEKIAIEFIKKINQEKKACLNKSRSSSSTNQDITKNEDKIVPLQRLKILDTLEPDQIADLIKDEHPQTIAAIALYLESQVASEVISHLPDDLITDVSLRVANTDKILSGMIMEVNNVFEDLLRNKKTSSVQKTSGVKQLAEILNYSDQIIAEQILNDIEKKNPVLAEEIKQRMFIFEDLVLIDDKGMQKVLRKIETSELALALKGASDDVKRKILNNMSKRAAEMLMEEIENIGAVRMKDVETAQQSINRVIQEMVAANEVIIAGRGGEQFIS